MRTPLKYAVIAVTPLLLAACANKERDELIITSTNRAQATADQANATAREALATAQAAKATADQALKAADAANEKADLMYQRGLRK